MVTFNPASRTVGDREAALRGGARITNALGTSREAFVAHPYPITPYDPDYLYHFDLVQAHAKGGQNVRWAGLHRGPQGPGEGTAGGTAPRRAGQHPAADGRLVEEVSL